MPDTKEVVRIGDNRPSVPDGPPDGGLLAWLQVVGSFCLYFCTWGVIGSFGSFQTIYERDELATHTPFQISVIGSLQTFIMVFSGFIVGPVYDSGYFRHLLGVGSVFIVVGTVLQSISTRYWQYLLTQGLMIGIGTGCLSILSVAIPSLWFAKKLPLANGLAACGSGLGGVVLPIMIRELSIKTTLQWATRAMALILLVLLLFSNIALRPRGSGTSRRPFIDKTAFTDWPYLMFVAGCFSVFLGMYTPFVHVQSYALDRSIVSPDLALYLLAILNSSSIFGRIVPAFLAQYLGPMNTITGAAAVLAITSFSLIVAKTAPRLLATVIVQGFITGSFFAMQPTIFVRLTGDPRKIGTRFGMAFSAMSFALLFGPPVGGALRKSLGYTAAWIWAGLTILTGSFLILCSRLLKDRKSLKL